MLNPQEEQTVTPAYVLAGLLTALAFAMLL